MKDTTVYMCVCNSCNREVIRTNDTRQQFCNFCSEKFWSMVESDAFRSGPFKGSEYPLVNHLAPIRKVLKCD
ncbi:hypothetical protein JOC75_004002 [Metabacillus crassostreae]|uniref:hypothetical protein n=1 Tax=Metabacillus crassostreae TaxID=929098 RepID=UPI00195B4088|nr:hypothetical protein [Metabacillus crassostreae]MBM7605974.1 hypothetical protein [Metabacillus crassostreae]